MLCWLGFHRYERKCLADYSGWTYPALFMVCSRCGDAPAFPSGDYHERPIGRCTNWYPDGFKG